MIFYFSLVLIIRNDNKTKAFVIGLCFTIQDSEYLKSVIKRHLERVWVVFLLLFLYFKNEILT